jgi:hypothetical protein
MKLLLGPKMGNTNGHTPPKSVMIESDANFLCAA